MQKKVYKKGVSRNESLTIDGSRAERWLEQFDKKCLTQRNCHEKMVGVQSVGVRSSTKSLSSSETVTVQRKMSHAAKYSRKEGLCAERWLEQTLSHKTKLSRNDGLCAACWHEQFDTKCLEQPNSHDRMVCVQSVGWNSLTNIVSRNEAVTKRRKDGFFVKSNGLNSLAKHVPRIEIVTNRWFVPRTMTCTGKHASRNQTVTKNDFCEEQGRAQLCETCPTQRDFHKMIIYVQRVGVHSLTTTFLKQRSCHEKRVCEEQWLEQLSERCPTH